LTSEDFISIGKIAYFSEIEKFDPEKGKIKTYLYRVVYYETIHAIQDDSIFKLHYKDKKCFWKLETIRAVMLNYNIPWTEAVAQVLDITIEEAEKLSDLNVGFVELDLELFED
jgi:DNA-directed RNA polymerase specialized sigma subunit